MSSTFVTTLLSLLCENSSPASRSDALQTILFHHASAVRNKTSDERPYPEIIMNAVSAVHSRRIPPAESQQPTVTGVRRTYAQAIEHVRSAYGEPSPASHHVRRPRGPRLNGTLRPAPLPPLLRRSPTQAPQTATIVRLTAVQGRFSTGASATAASPPSPQGQDPSAHTSKAPARTQSGRRYPWTHSTSQGLLHWPD